MTNISKKETTSDDYVFAYKQLTKFLSGLHENNAHFLIEELLTETERIMLVKRFAAIFMFQQDYTPYRVSLTIDISESTAQRLYHGFQIGDYDNLLKCTKKSEKSEFIAILQDLVMSKASFKARSRLLKRAMG
jgi:hypothetical protein